MPGTAPILDHVVIDVRDRMDEAARIFTGLGFWTRANPELCLLATRGRALR